MADNVDQPSRTIPRATVIGTLVTAIVYIFSTIGVMGALPPDVLEPRLRSLRRRSGAIWGPGRRLS